jgi:molybdopterin-dependent oxidoreductase-like protein protein
VANGPLSLAQAPARVSVAELHIGGAVGTPLTLAVEDLKKLPRKTFAVTIRIPGTRKYIKAFYSKEFCARAGVPDGELLHGAAMATYIVAEAADGYRVVFSLRELDSGILENDIIVADTLDGAPQPEKEGPFKIVASLEKRLALGSHAQIHHRRPRTIIHFLSFSSRAGLYPASRPFQNCGLVFSVPGRANLSSV